MKGKKIIILVIILMIGAITTFAVASSYAKYKSSIEGSDKARVAKWNIGGVTSVDLFKDSVVSGVTEDKNGNKKIAPGSYGEYLFQISGTAETNFRLYLDVDGCDSIGKENGCATNIDNRGDVNGKMQYVLTDTSAEIKYDKNQGIIIDEDYIYGETNDIDELLLLIQTAYGPLLSNSYRDRVLPANIDLNRELNDGENLTYKIVWMWVANENCEETGSCESDEYLQAVNNGELQVKFDIRLRAEQTTDAATYKIN